MGNRNRDKGNNYERKIAQELRDLGFNDVVTSRYASKETDDNKIDLVVSRNGKQKICLIVIYRRYY